MYFKIDYINIMITYTVAITQLRVRKISSKVEETGEMFSSSGNHFLIDLLLNTLLCSQTTQDDYLYTSKFPLVVWAANWKNCGFLIQKLAYYFLDKDTC